MNFIAFDFLWDIVEWYKMNDVQLYRADFEIYFKGSLRKDWRIQFQLYWLTIAMNKKSDCYDRMLHEP